MSQPRPLPPARRACVMTAPTPGPWLGFPDADFTSPPVYAATLDERHEHDARAERATDGNVGFEWVSIPCAQAAPELRDALRQCHYALGELQDFTASLGSSLPWREAQQIATAADGLARAVLARLGDKP